MISLDYDKPSAYAFVNGMVNQAWLAGIAGDIEANANPARFKLYQNSNANLALPVELKIGDYLPSIVKEGIAIKVDGHIYGRKVDGERIAVFRAIKVTSPTYLDMPGELAWKASEDGIKPRKWPDGVPPSPYTPEFREPTESEVRDAVRQITSADNETRFVGSKRLTNLFRLVEGDQTDNLEIFRNQLKLKQAANLVRIAGIVEGAFMALDENGKEQSDTLVILLRQDANPDLSIPVRVYNRLARKFYELIRVGTPVLILGSYRQRVKVVAPANTPGGVDVVSCLPYIHTNSVRVATTQDIRIVPRWAEELARKMSAAARFRLGRTSEPSVGGAQLQDQPRRRPLPDLKADASASGDDPKLTDAIAQDFAELEMDED